MADALAWEAILAVAVSVFTQPAFRLFRHIACGWVLCPARHTITGMLPSADPDGAHAHDAFHRFFRDAVWKTAPLWKALTVALAAALLPADQPVGTSIDDTIAHKTGPKVNGAGVFRDPVRSTKRKVVYAFGLNVVVLSLRVHLPWAPHPFGLPVNLRLYRKGGPSHVKLAADMLRDLTEWLPLYHFILTADGAYASLAKLRPPRTHVTSRMRRDAALHDIPAPRLPGQRGRPRKKGPRLPTPPAIASQASTDHWKLTEVRMRGRTVQRRLLARTLLWYKVATDAPVLLVIVRDPAGREHDDFFFTTDIHADPGAVVSDYAGRWSIEVTFRDAKQILGAEQPQSWRRQGPERTVTLAFWLHSAVWLWYITVRGDKISWPLRPWYTRKRSPSFADALAALRSALWRQRLSASSATKPELSKIAASLVDLLARAG